MSANPSWPTLVSPNYSGFNAEPSQTGFDFRSNLKSILTIDYIKLGAITGSTTLHPTAHCFKVSYRTFLFGKLPVFIVTAPNFQNMSAIPLALMGYLGIHLKSCYMP